MDSFCIYCILVLQKYLTSFYSFPKEIIMLIISMIPDIKICCGPECTTFIINDIIYTCDKNNLVPRKQIFNEKIDSIHYGSNHIIFVEKSKKAIYGRGWNQYGQLGLGDFVDKIKTKTTSHQIMFKSELESKIMLVSCSDGYTVIVTESGEIYGWGYNREGSIKNPLGFVRVSRKTPEGFSRIN